MPAYRDRDSNNGTWFAKFSVKDWTGKSKQVKKRGFATKKEALDFERNYKLQKAGEPDMTFGDFFEVYTTDMMQKLKENTWLTKEHIVKTKILPYFKDKRINEISAADVLKWQNELISMQDERGRPLSTNYRKTIHNQLSCIFNHACRFYGLRENLARKAGNMGREEKIKMQFWTKEEYLQRKDPITITDDWIIRDKYTKKYGMYSYSYILTYS